MIRRRIWVSFSLLVVLLLGCLEIPPQGPTVSPEEPPLSEKTMSVVALDIGQGDSILVISPNGRTMLVDGGNSSQDGREVILPYLRGHGFDKLDVMVLTHPDADHAGGLPTVLRSVPVDVVVSTGQMHTTEIYAEFLEELQKARDERGTQVIRGVAGAEIPFDPVVKVQVLGPSRSAIEGEDRNNASIVLRLTYGQVTVLLTGDAEVEEERWLMGQGYDLRAQVLKVSHHGSNTGSSDPFLNAVGAQVALISCSADNPYGHPHADVLERLARHGSEIYRTDTQGTIEVTIDGSGYQVETAR